MSIQISARTDYSMLFSTLSSNSNKNNGASNMLGISLIDYGTIKSGAYSKLMKAYYNRPSDTDKSSSTSKPDKESASASADSAVTQTALKSSSKALSEAADKLMAKGKESVFEKKDVTVKDENGVETKTQEYDKDAIYSAVSDFVNGYNKVMEYSAESNNSNVLSTATNMVKSTAGYSKMLSDVGINVGADNKLSIDKEKFMEADVEKVKNLFAEKLSYGDSVQSKASGIQRYASRDAEKASGLYSQKATYDSNLLNSGYLYNGIF